MPHSSYVNSAYLMLDHLDFMTALHCIGVARLAVLIATELQLPQCSIDCVELGGLLHDQGKRAITAEIILKDSKLTVGEYMLVKSHPVISRELITANVVEFPEKVSKIAEQHHERLDGTGYPYGLKGSQILIETQVVAVADTIDAMLHRRPYKKNTTPRDIIGPELLSLSGKAFLPEVVDAALKVM